MLETVFSYAILVLLLCLVILAMIAIIAAANAIFYEIFDKTIPEFFAPCWRWLIAKLKGENSK